MELLTEFSTQLIIGNDTIEFNEILIMENLSTYNFIPIEKTALNRNYYNFPEISFYDLDTDTKMTYQSSNNNCFTVKQLFNCILDFYKILNPSPKILNFNGLQYNINYDSYIIKFIN